MSIQTRDTAEPQPYIGNDPEITLNDQTVRCLASHVELSPDVSTVETPTFCGTLEFPGQVKWYLRLTVYTSFDEGGTYTLLKECLALGTVPYTIKPFRDRPVSETNPEFSGDAIVKPFTILSMDAGAASTIDLEWVCTAEPTMSTTSAEPAKAAAAKKTTAA